MRPAICSTLQCSGRDASYWHMVRGVIDSKINTTPLKGRSTAQMDTSPMANLKAKSEGENPSWRYFPSVPGSEKSFILPSPRSRMRSVGRAVNDVGGTFQLVATDGFLMCSSVPRQRENDDHGEDRSDHPNRYTKRRLGFVSCCRRGSDGNSRSLAWDDNCSDRFKQGDYGPTSRAFDALSEMRPVGVIDDTASWTGNINHDRGNVYRGVNNILFWDIEERLAIIQPS